MKKEWLNLFVLIILHSFLSFFYFGFSNGFWGIIFPNLGLPLFLLNSTVVMSFSIRGSWPIFITFIFSCIMATSGKPGFAIFWISFISIFFLVRLILSQTFLDSRYRIFFIWILCFIIFIVLIDVLCWLLYKKRMFTSSKEIAKSMASTFIFFLPQLKFETKLFSSFLSGESDHGRVPQ